MNINIRRYLSFSVVIGVLLWVLAGAIGAAQQHFKPGKARWLIKTSVPESVDLQKSKQVSYDDLAKLEAPQDVKKNDKRYQDARIPAFDNSLKVEEGDILTTRGWFHLVAAEADGDYHIQISNAQDSQASCVIVEVPTPEPDFVASEAVRSVAKNVRDFIKTKLLKGKEPSTGGSLMNHSAYMEVTGQLFYDDAHVGDKPRGKKGCKAATLWELHPVTAIRFAPKPAQ